MSDDTSRNEEINAEGTPEDKTAACEARLHRDHLLEDATFQTPIINTAMEALSNPSMLDRIIGEEQEFGYLPFDSQFTEAGDQDDAILALVMAAIATGMHPIELIAMLAELDQLFRIIAEPILPPAGTLLIMGRPHHAPDRGDIGPYSPFDRMAAQRRARRQERFEQMRSGIVWHPLTHRLDPDVINNMEDRFANWRHERLAAMVFAKGMAQRGALFISLISTGLTPDVDADEFDDTEAINAANTARAFVTGRQLAETDPGLPPNVTYVEFKRPGTDDPEGPTPA
ncbi:MAG TPA: hypothetical protein VJ843_01225 [Candidatus Saccharimonadales bacterium]|nr:hypothetical protein [Candidatus Saccharimonadales bacterium]